MAQILHSSMRIGLRAVRRGLVVVLALGGLAQRSAAAATVLPLRLQSLDSDPRALCLGLDKAPPPPLGLDPEVLAPPDASPAALMSGNPIGSLVDAPAPPARPSLGAFPRRVWRDFGALSARPLSLDSRDWTMLALGTGLVGVAAGFDNRIRSAVQAHGGAASLSFARRIRPIGTWGGLAAMGILFGAGELSGNADLAATGADGLEADLFAGGIIAPALKKVVGRSRPSSGADSDETHFFSGGQSFPSGEATEAFTLAAVVSSHTDSLPLRGLAWGLAGLVGWERMRLDAHWASDVVAGALIGIAVGRWVSNRDHVETAGHASFAIQPTVGPKGLGVSATLSW